MIAVVLVKITLAGCTMFAAESKIAEYKQQAEEIRSDVVAQFSAEVAAGENSNLVSSEPRYETLNGSGDSPSDPVHWQVLDDWTFPQRAGLSQETAEVVIAHLEAEGRERTDQTTQAKGYAIIDSFSKADVDGDAWFLRLTHTLPGGDPAEGMQILVSSPTTTRGEYPPVGTPPTRG